MNAEISNNHFPDFEQASMLTASMMLAYVLGEFIHFPATPVSLEAYGFHVDFTLNASLLHAVMTALLAASGTSWLIHRHPERRDPDSLAHAVLPALTAWVLSITLAAIPDGTAWWLVLFAGTGFLAMVWLAEYITVDPTDANFRLATNALTALSFALFLALMMRVRADNLRLIFLLPTVILPVFGITYRYLNLKLQMHRLDDAENNRLAMIAAGVAGLAAGQIATAFHFFALPPLSFAFALLAPLYAAAILFGNLVEDRPAVRTALEPVVITGVFWLMAIIVK